MEKTSKELLKEFVKSQHFTSTTDIMNSMKELFSDVLQTVMEAELEDKLGYEKSERVSDNTEKNMSKNYRSVEKHRATLDGNLSELGYGIQPTFDNVRGQRDRIIGFLLLIFFPWAETVFTPAARIPSLPTGTMQLRGNPQ